MIFGSVMLEANAVVTHRDSYLLDNLTVVSVRRPFLPGAVSLGGSLCTFALAFADLLYAQEIALIICFSIAGLLAGFSIGQLKLLSRDLRGSELSGVIYGQYDHLNLVRREITAQLANRNGAGS